MAIQDSTFPLQGTLLLLHNNPRRQIQPQQDQDEDVPNDDKQTSATPVHVTDEDLQWSDDELTSLLKNETTQLKTKQRDSETETTVKWMMKVVNFFNFNPTTAILAVDYFDRFISISTSPSQNQRNVENIWTLQLTAVACLSLAAKVEETDPPLLLDIQVEQAKFVFESKTIQRMELLVLSTLQWRMHPATPFSYIDHFIRRLGLKSSNLQFHFIDHSSRILTSLVTDGRWGLYPSSALAYATMLHVMEMELDYNSSSMESDDDNEDDQTELFTGLITIFNKEKVSECYKLIQDMNIYNNKKRKFGLELDSPKDVVDHASSSSSSYDLLASDGTSNDSWDLSQSQSHSQQQPQPFSTSSSSELPLILLPALKRTRYTNGEDEVKDHNFEILE